MMQQKTYPEQCGENPPMGLSSGTSTSSISAGDANAWTQSQTTIKTIGAGVKNKFQDILTLVTSWEVHISLQNGMILMSEKNHL